MSYKADYRVSNRNCAVLHSQNLGQIAISLSQWAHLSHFFSNHRERFTPHTHFCHFTLSLSYMVLLSHYFSLPLQLPFLLLFQDLKCKALTPSLKPKWDISFSFLPKHTGSTLGKALSTLTGQTLLSKSYLRWELAGGLSAVCHLSISSIPCTVWQISLCAKPSFGWVTKEFVSASNGPRVDILPCSNTGSSGETEQNQNHDHLVVGELQYNFRDLRYWPSRTKALS